MKNPAVYMLASRRNGTLYIGVTSDLVKRVWQHRESVADGFSKKYGVKMLVWYEQHGTMQSAIAKEKAMKKWLRKWKLATIEQSNPDWIDLWPAIIGQANHPLALSTSVVPAHAGIQSVIPSGVANRSVIPANAGAHSVIAADAAIQDPGEALDSRIRGNDDYAALDAGGAEVLGKIKGLL